MTELGEGFDPQRLTAEASLQRVVIAALPGVPAAVAGRPASETCSRDALAGLVVETGGLPAPQPSRLGDQLAELRASPDAAIRDRARRALHAYGVRLGALLATLKHGGTADQQGDSPVRHACLEHWLSIERVWFGGGLLASGNAADIVAGARQLLARAGTGLDLRVGRWPTMLPLLGAARLAEQHDGRALVVDAGHSAIKAAFAVVNGQALAALETLPPRPAPLKGGVHAVEAAIVNVLAESAGALGSGPGRHGRVVLSVASYVRDGAPVDDGRSIYGGLAPERIRRLLAGRTGRTGIAGRTGRTGRTGDVVLEFVHDGSSSACGVADPEPSAVVTIGTWLGVGFTPPMRPVLGGNPVVHAWQPGRDTHHLEFDG